MSEGSLLFAPDKIQLQQEERNNRVRGKFRRLARQVAGEVFDVPEDNKIIFAYEKSLHVGQISFSLANLLLQEPGHMFDSDYYPQITFMFVLQDFQCYGVGRQMLQQAADMMRKHCPNRPVRLQSAENAVAFFEKCGFKVVSEPIECFHSGSKLFRTLVNMELDLTQT